MKSYHNVSFGDHNVNLLIVLCRVKVDDNCDIDVYLSHNMMMYTELIVRMSQ